MLNGYLIAGLSKTLVAYRYTEDTSATASLEKLAAYRPSSMPIDLDISGNMIGLGDLKQSLTLVEFQPPTNESKAKLIERARDYQPSQTTAVCQLGGDRWLEADALGNLVVLWRNAEAPTEQDQRRLEITSEMNLGEQINRIRSLHVAPTENSLVQSKAFLGSVSQLQYTFVLHGY
jgi:DNA damage-binding protein 1